MLKVHASKAMELCAREAMQILGGAGYLRANSGPGKVERIYREVRLMHWRWIRRNNVRFSCKTIGI